MTAPVEARNRHLLAWYRANRRALPWRSTLDPWPILVSEVMSQQTQISRVVPVFQRFLERFPSPDHLAAADLAEVILIWDGLGYQRRAVNLWRAAAILSESGWPTGVSGLRRLPGVGPYTAAAVACFAYGEPVAAVDTNLRRVVGRWFGHPISPNDSLDRLVDPDDPAGWNQAVMDLGAGICRPSAPDCRVCPVSDWCADPSVYVAPPRQSRYQGSVRQARAEILKTLAQGDLVELPPPNTMEAKAVEGLLAEGIVEQDRNRLTLAGRAGQSAVTG